jgi:hypothetical protein
MNRLSLLMLLYLSFLSIALKAKELKYPVSTIPESLLKNAKVVVRNFSDEYEVFSLSDISENITEAITIFDRSSLDLVSRKFPYNNNSEITGIEVNFYDKDGSLIEKKKRKDFKDLSYDQYGTLFSDIRYLFFTPLISIYPFTIEYIITYKNNISFINPSWHPVTSKNTSVEFSSITINVPENYNINYKEYFLKNGVQKSLIKGKTRYYWELKNYPAEDYEIYSPPIQRFTPHVLITFPEFEFEKIEGKLYSWRDFGNFQKMLNKDRDILPEKTKQKVHEMVKYARSDIEKAKILYKYMQDRTRYVGIQVGIGGWQPFPAKTVDELGYGDCKALSNYMVTLLKEVGIKSYYSVIKAKSHQYEMDTSFVHDPFNHIIVCVPLDQDTIWLECTSQIMPFGYLGDFTDNRYALVVNESGGELVKTKEYKHNLNQVNRKATVTLNPDGTGTAKIKTGYNGLEYDDILYYIHSDYKTQMDNLYKCIDIPDFKINSFYYKDFPEIDPIGEEYLNLDLTNYASVSGIRMFVPLNLMNKFDEIPPNDERKNPIVIYDNYIYTDSIVYLIPEGYKIEFVPENNSIESEFASVHYTIKIDSNQVYYTRKLELFNKEYPKEKYNDFVSFCKNLKKGDTQKLILVKTK